ncbi:MAG: hypothetical protein IJK87_02890 [Prevotella sp.]|nr:hypothetical protein [Prevotella sp.]
MDKVTFGKNREIEKEAMAHIFIFALYMPFSRPIYPFNIFWAASVADGCHIRTPQLRHLSPADAAQKMLNRHIYP